MYAYSHDAALCNYSFLVRLHVPSKSPYRTWWNYTLSNPSGMTVHRFCMYRSSAKESSSPTFGREIRHFDHLPSQAAPDNSRRLNNSLAVVTDLLGDRTALIQCRLRTRPGARVRSAPKLGSSSQHELHAASAVNTLCMFTHLIKLVHATQ